MRQLLTLNAVAISVVLASCSRTDSVSRTSESTSPVAIADDRHADERNYGGDTRGHGQDAHRQQTKAEHEGSKDEHTGHGKQRHAPGHNPRHADQSTETSAPHVAEGLTALQLFKRRITPIMQAKNPSSCSECHLSGVDLKQYIGPDQEMTFASLRASGLIDMEDPDASKILTFIQRSPQKPSLVSDKVRKEEYAAFRAWIHAAVKDPQLAEVDASDAALGPTISDEVIRHARKDRVLASFIDNVWTEVGRCAACHSPDRNQKQVKEHGQQVSWIKLRDPEETLSHMVEAGIINSAEPLESMLLTKPTMQVEHGGGQKMVVGDRTYKQFRRFIDDYASVVNAKYTSTDDLPKQSNEVSTVTEIWFKFTDVPEKYDQMLLQVDLYRWTDGVWSEHRVASADRLVFGKGKLWQHSLSLTAQRGSKWADEIKLKTLPPGRYLAKLYIDQDGKLQEDFQSELGDDDFVGQIEIESRWPKGYGNMTVAEFP